MPRANSLGFSAGMRPTIKALSAPKAVEIVPTTALKKEKKKVKVTPVEAKKAKNVAAKKKYVIKIRVKSKTLRSILRMK